jgi:hypothetical protein
MHQIIENIFPGLMKIVTFFLFFSLLNCDRKDDNNYHVKIQYLNSIDENSIDRRYGIVALSFPSFYDEDTILLEVNKKRFLEEVISTSEITGSALIVAIDSVNKVNEIGIKINNREKVLFKCNLENQLFIIELRKDSLFINGVTSFPTPR